MADNTIFENIRIPHSNNSSDEEILEDLRRIVNKEHLLWMSEGQYKKLGGRYNPATIVKRFNANWDIDLGKIGLKKRIKDLKNISSVHQQKSCLGMLKIQQLN